MLPFCSNGAFGFSEKLERLAALSQLRQRERLSIVVPLAPATALVTLPSGFTQMVTTIEPTSSVFDGGKLKFLDSLPTNENVVPEPPVS